MFYLSKAISHTYVRSVISSAGEFLVCMGIHVQTVVGLRLIKSIVPPFTLVLSLSVCNTWTNWY